MNKRTLVTWTAIGLAALGLALWSMKKEQQVEEPIEETTPEEPTPEEPLIIPVKFFSASEKSVNREKNYEFDLWLSQSLTDYDGHIEYRQTEAKGKLSRSYACDNPYSYEPFFSKRVSGKYDDGTMYLKLVTVNPDGSDEPTQFDCYDNELKDVYLSRYGRDFVDLYIEYDWLCQAYEQENKNISDFHKRLNEVYAPMFLDVLVDWVNDGGNLAEGNQVVGNLELLQSQYYGNERIILQLYYPFD